MDVVVTGGAGFIGSAVVQAFLAAGHRVTVVDDLSRGRLSRLPAPGPQLDVVELDVRDPSLGAVLRRVSPEVVLHLAARIDVRSSVLDPVGDATVNVLGTIAVAEAARSAGVRKIVFASSGGSIYGDPRTLPVGEDAPLDPLSPYAVAKVSGELYLNALTRLHGMQCTHLAPANVYGPGQDADGEAGVVAIFARALLAGRPTTVYGDGGNTRDYVFVDDVAAAFVSAAGERGDRRRYNIGTGVQVSDRELHTLVAAAAGCPDRPGSAPARIGDVRASALDSRRARSELGWSPRVTLRDGIAATVDHVRRAAVTSHAGG